MGEVILYLREFYKREFRFWYLISVIGLLGFIFYLNYWHGLESSITSPGKSGWLVFCGYFLLYFIPFAAAFFLQPFFYTGCHYVKSFWYWIILLTAPAFFAFRVAFFLNLSHFGNIWQGDEHLFWVVCISWILKVFLVFIPVYIFWWVKDKGKSPVYGIVALKNSKPYLLMLAIMVPIILLACSQKDFLQMYPRAGFIASLNLPSKNLYYLIFELCYGFDFVSIEFFFRGFLILSLINICGPHAIIPAACFYFTIHFGKPPAEAVSSFLGGLFLGIVSYNIKSIWGGVMIHLGIAWLFEICTWLVIVIRT